MLLIIFRLTLPLAAVVLVVAACTLGEPEAAPTWTPVQPQAALASPTVRPTITPLGTPPPNVTSTPIAGVPVVVTPLQSRPTVVVAPNPEFERRSEDIVTALLNRLIIPVFNFVFTLVVTTTTSLWEAAGYRGGVTAQTLCCLVPGFIAIAWFFRYIFRRTGFRRFW